MFYLWLEPAYCEGGKQHRLSPVTAGPECDCVLWACKLSLYELNRILFNSSGNCLISMYIMFNVISMENKEKSGASASGIGTF